MHIFYCPGNNVTQQNYLKKVGKSIQCFLLFKRKAACVNHYFSIMSPDHRYLPFLSTVYSSLTSWVYPGISMWFLQAGVNFFMLWLKGAVYHSFLYYLNEYFSKSGDGLLSGRTSVCSTDTSP